jgi:hypothetical protein
MRRLVNYCLVVVLTVGVPLGSYVWYSTWHGEHLAEGIVAQLDAEGPWRWDDLVAARPATADNQLAPELIEKVHGVMPAAWLATWIKARAFDVFSERPEVLMTPEQAARLAEQMDQVREAVAEGRGIVNLPKGRVRLFSVKSDRWSKCSQFTVLMNADAVHQAHLGDLDAAIESHFASWQAARAMEDELRLSPHVDGRGGWELTTLIYLERTLAQGQPTPQALARMQTAVADADPVAAFRAGAAGERAHIEQICRRLESGEMKFEQMHFRGTPQFVYDGYLRASLQQARAALLKALTETIAAVDLPAPERLARWREIGDEVGSAPGIAICYRDSIAHFGSWFIRHEAKRQCTLAALAAERFRRETNRWPKSLDELTPKFLAEIPLDPCNDQPLGYRSTRDGVVMFSVGPEGKYNGAYRDRPQPGENAAFEFRLWNVAKRRQLAGARP